MKKLYNHSDILPKKFRYKIQIQIQKCFFFFPHHWKKLKLQNIREWQGLNID